MTTYQQRFSWTSAELLQATHKLRKDIMHLLEQFDADFSHTQGPSLGSHSYAMAHRVVDDVLRWKRLGGDLEEEALHDNSTE